MLPYRDSRITVLALVVFFLLIIAYAYFEASDALFGPKIMLTNAPESVSAPFITLKGRAENIAELRINGDPVPVTEDGAFEEPYLLAPGYNRIVLEAKDQYDRSVEQVLSIEYTPPETPPGALENTETASSTEVLPDGE